MPDKLYVACGASVAFLMAGFVLVGAHREVCHRLRRLAPGGRLMKGDMNGLLDV